MINSHRSKFPKKPHTIRNLTEGVGKLFPYMKPNIKKHCQSKPETKAQFDNVFLFGKIPIIPYTKEKVTWQKTYHM